ncbi:hypothetical protein TNCV_2166081 [Trichonephila clavipes]|nr:hypothetical protein TNCV_2166081 [Trichonephila clavipes]
MTDDFGFTITGHFCWMQSKEHTELDAGHKGQSLLDDCLPGNSSSRHSSYVTSLMSSSGPVQISLLYGRLGQPSWSEYHLFGIDSIARRSFLVPLITIEPPPILQTGQLQACQWLCN